MRRHYSSPEPRPVVSTWRNPTNSSVPRIFVRFYLIQFLSACLNPQEKNTSLLRGQSYLKYAHRRYPEISSLLPSRRGVLCAPTSRGLAYLSTPEFSLYPPAALLWSVRPRHALARGARTSTRSARISSRSWRDHSGRFSKADPPVGNAGAVDEPEQASPEACGRIADSHGVALTPTLGKQPSGAGETVDTPIAPRGGYPSLCELGCGIQKREILP